MKQQHGDEEHRTPWCCTVAGLSHSSPHTRVGWGACWLGPPHTDLSYCATCFPRKGRRGRKQPRVRLLSSRPSRANPWRGRCVKGFCGVVRSGGAEGRRGMNVAAVSTQLLTEQDVVAMLHCSLRKVRRYRAKGVLRAFYVGTEPVFRVADVCSLQRRCEPVRPAVAFATARRFGAGRPATRVVQPILADTTEMQVCSCVRASGAVATIN